VPQVGSTCYASDGAALSAIASGEVGKVVPAGAVVYVVDAAPSGASSIAYTLTPADGSASGVSSTVALTLQPCNLLDWSDGLELGWGVGGVWILAAVVMGLRKAAE
jgi:hypothetical protein